MPVMSASSHRCRRLPRAFPAEKRLSDVVVIKESPAQCRVGGVCQVFRRGCLVLVGTRPHPGQRTSVGQECLVLIGSRRIASWKRKESSGSVTSTPPTWLAFRSR